MKKWQPDLSPSEFQTVLQSPIHWGSCFLNFTVDPHKANEPSLNKDAWYIDEGGAYYVFIPWRKIEAGQTFGQAIRAHNTHMIIKNNIYSKHDSILDVGGYDGIWAWLFEASSKTILDVCEEALMRWAAIHADIVCQDAKYLSTLFQPDSFDVVFLLDVLEHMEEESAFACVEGAEKIAKYQVIVATPDGYQPFDDWKSILYPPPLHLRADVPCAELMAHKSG